MIEIKLDKNCCGCEACVNICPKQCIEMQAKSDGFLYPIVDKEKCINCHLCELVCPELKRHKAKHPIKCYAARSNSKNILSKSSSGGIFSELALSIINSGGVVFGARFNSEWELIHDYTDRTDNLDQFRGSKYVQSRINHSYKEVKNFLINNRKVLFCGTPCQIAGLKNYLRKEYDNLILVDLICHGVPSPLIFRNYLDEIINENDCSIKNILFRDKHYGWKNFSFTIESKSNSSHNDIIMRHPIMTDSDIFMKLFLNNYILRPSCYTCKFKQNKSGADISLGDLWGVSKFNIMDDDLGISLILLQTNKGISEFSKLNIFSKELRYNDILGSNPAIIIPSRKQNYKVTIGNYHNVDFSKNSTANKYVYLFEYLIKKYIHLLFTK